MLFQGSDEGYFYTTGDYGDHTYNFQGPLFGAHSPGTTEWYPGRSGDRTPPPQDKRTCVRPDRPRKTLDVIRLQKQHGRRSPMLFL